MQGSVGGGIRTGHEAVPHTMPHILVVGDDEALGHRARRGLEARGHSARRDLGGEAGYGAAILDLTLPGAEMG